MTTLTTGLTDPLQRLIDERLDTIDRVLLMAGVARDERRTTVAEVESQIHEMLAQSAPAGPQRGDVLAVLARLDPPEAYVPEDGQVLALNRTTARPASAGNSLVEPSALLPVGSVAAAAMGGMALVGVIVGVLYESMEIMLMCGVVSMFFGIVATIGGVASLFKLRDAKSPHLMLPLAVFSMLFLPLTLINLAQLFVVLIFGELAIYPAIGCTILLTDAAVTYAAWRGLSKRMKALAA